MKTYSVDLIHMHQGFSGRYGSNPYNMPDEYYSKEEVDEHLEVLIQDQKDSNHRIEGLLKSIDILEGRYTSMFRAVVASGEREIANAK